jgi:hypothetical protein
MEMKQKKSFGGIEKLRFFASAILEFKKKMLNPHENQSKFLV